MVGSNQKLKKIIFWVLSEINYRKKFSQVNLLTFAERFAYVTNKSLNPIVVFANNCANAKKTSVSD